MPQPSSSGLPPPANSTPAEPKTIPQQVQTQQNQQQQKPSPSPSPRTHHSQPVPIHQQRGSHSPHAPRSPSLAYHSSSQQGQPPTSASSSPARLPRPQNTAELHQELEREQEGVVNRLLHMIRSASQTSLPPQSPPATSTSHPVHPGPPGRQTSFTSEDGRRHSRQNSDASDLWMVGGGMGGRDEAAFYRTEAEMLVRENEMLRRRIRELEEMTSKAKLKEEKKEEPAKSEKEKKGSTA